MTSHSNRLYKQRLNLVIIINILKHLDNNVFASVYWQRQRRYLVAMATRCGHHTVQTCSEDVLLLSWNPIHEHKGLSRVLVQLGELWEHASERGSRFASRRCKFWVGMPHLLSWLTTLLYWADLHRHVYRALSLSSWKYRSLDLNQQLDMHQKENKSLFSIILIVYAMCMAYVWLSWRFRRVYCCFRTKTCTGIHSLLFRFAVVKSMFFCSPVLLKFITCINNCVYWQSQ